MKVLICIDDTDNLESPGTGALCQMLLQAIEERQWGRCSFISRHQLFVHPDVPYTSHNSAMCFEADLVNDRFSDVRELAIELLMTHQAPGSDPGLCMTVKDQIPDPAGLIAYARSAKISVLTKAAAYAMAESQQILLSEHGGTGQGVIGALAGVGLRLFGHDGRVKGKVEVGEDGSIMNIRELLSSSGFAAVRGLDGSLPEPDDQILITEGRIKAVLQDWKSVIPVIRKPESRDGCKWQTLSKIQYKSY